MKKNILILASLCLSLQLGTAFLHAASTAAPAEKTFPAPNGMTVGVKMVGPYAQACDLQIVCAFKHKVGGDTYLGAMKDLDAKLGGLISSLRNRGEFKGDLGESILITPPAGSILAKKLLVIGLGEESNLSLDTLKIVARIGLRQAVALKTSNVAFAPVIRDQGNSTIDVGEGDGVVIENVILTYDTEKRLQQQKLAPSFRVKTWIIEAGPSYFESAVQKVQAGLSKAAVEIKKRNNTSYSSLK